MDITYRIEKNILYIAAEGRIDASNASEAEERIFSIKNENPGMHVVIDADKLEYISSAGLRVILRLRKEEPKLAIINVTSEVYGILDMTGFTDMVTVEKAYPRMSVEGCEFLAKGATGAVYRYDAETIVKVYFAKDALPEIKQERENARRAFVLGVNTAIPYGIVRIDEGYGTVTELLNAVSITKLIRENPNDLTEALKYYVDMLKTIHSIEAEDGEFPDIQQRTLGWVDFIASHLPEVQVRKLRALIEAIPKKNTLQHGDYHTNNIMVQNGEPLLIDMDTLCMGHPVFELATMFNAFIGFDKLSPQHSTMNFFGFDFETSKKFFELAVKAYLGTDDEAVCQAIVEKAMLIGYVKLLRHTLRRKEASDYAERIAHCQEKIAELLEKTDCLYY